MEKIKKAKSISIILLFMMVFQLMMPVSFAYGADDREITDDVIIEKIIIEIKDKTGTNVLYTSDSVTSGTAISGIPRDAKISINVGYALPDQDGEGNDIEYNVDDYFKIIFPDAIKFSDGIDGTVFDSGDVAARINLSGNEATLTLTKIASDMHGEFYIDGQFDGSKIEENEDAEIELDFMGHIIKIGFENYEEPDININLAKKGKGVWTEEGILWTLEVTPSATASNVNIKDIFRNNQEFVEGSFKVNGQPTTDSVISGNVITYEFPAEITGKQTITYLTKPKLDAFDGIETGTNKTVDFTNDAEVYLGTILKGIDKDKITLDGISKTGLEVSDFANGRRIKWEVTINNYGGMLNGKNAKIEDQIDTKLQLVEGDSDAKIQIKFDNNDAVTLNFGDYIITSGNLLTYNFPATSFNKVVLSYYTDIKDPDANANDNSLTFNNVAYLKWDGMTNGGASDGVGVGINNGLISKNSTFTSLYVNGTNETITWTVTINRNNLNIGNAEFKDIIQNGLEYVAGSFTLNGTGAPAFIPTVGVPTATGTSISYTFPSTITNKQTIVYKTKILDSFDGLFKNGGDTLNSNGIKTKTNTAFINSATLTGDKGIHTSTKTQNVQSEVINKTALSDDGVIYNYDTGRIKYQIVINKSKINLTGAVLTDKLPEGMNYVPGTFYDNDVKIEPDPVLGNGISYTLGDIDDIHTITFEVEIDKEYLKDQNRVNKDIQFINTAKLKANNLETESSYKITIKNNIIGKDTENSSYGDDGYIEWAVPINAAKLQLTDIKISDKLQNELELDESSIQLFKATVNPKDGKLTTVVQALKLQDFDNLDSITEDGYYYAIKDNELTLFIKGTVNEPFILKFTTEILVKNVTVNNTVNFKGSSIDKGATNNTGQIIVTGSGGSISGATGKLNLYKIDKDKNPIELPSKFDIYRIFAGQQIDIVSEKLTEDGKISLENLLYKKYYIQEIEAPDGYLLDPTVHEVWVNKLNPQLNYYFVNEKAEADIVFTKQNNFGKNLSSAEFTLYESDKTAVKAGPVSSGSDGEVKFSDIAPGTYYIKETGTPKGYKPLTDFIKVTVSIINGGTEMGVEFNDEGINEPYKITNNLIDDGVMVIKVDTSGKFLEGAVFGIYDNDTGDKIKEATSDENGIVLFEGIEAGEYYIEEINPPAGYTKSIHVVYVKVEEDANDSKKLIVSYKNGDQPYSSDPLEFVNDPINIEFIKQDNNGESLTGAEFTLYEENGTTVFEGRDPVTSNNEGKVVFTAIPVGEYVIKETNAPSGYRELGKDIIVEVAINGDSEPVIIFTYSDESDVETDEDGKLIVTNERKPSTPGIHSPVYGKIAIKKTDEDKKVLSGAEFTLYDEDSKVFDRGVTGSDGTLSFEDLEPGKYVLKETKAPEGYVLEVNETEVTVVGNRTNTYSFTNKKEEPKKPGRIEIVKIDEEGALLSEAWFSLIDGNGTTSQNAVTVNGRAEFEDVPVGRYTVKEVQAPEGYELTEQQVNVTVDSEKTVTVRFVNKKSGTTVVLVSGRIAINKVNENNMALAGAEFTLYNENNEIIGTAVSDASGRVIFENLKDGKYFVRETEAPEGYRLVSDSLTVDITGGSSHSYRFRNVPDTEEIGDPNIPLGWEEIDDPEIPGDVVKLPNTGSLLNTWLMIAIGLMLIFAGMFLFRKEVTNN